MIKVQAVIKHEDLFTDDFSIEIPNAEYASEGNFSAYELVKAAVVEFAIIKDGVKVEVRGDRVDCCPETGAGSFETEDFGPALVFDVPANAIFKIVTVAA